jgi:hypothetical protein
MRPFDSGKFFRDEFFRKAASGDDGSASVTSNSTTATVRCSHRSGLDPMRDGGLIQRGGKWEEIGFWIPDWETAFGAGAEPAHGDLIVIDADTFRVEATDRQGDVFCIKALANPRLMSRSGFSKAVR